MVNIMFHCLGGKVRNKTDNGILSFSAHYYSPYACQLGICVFYFHFPLSCIGEGNGNPLQCSCLENPRDGGARWAAVHGVAQSRSDLAAAAAAAAAAGLFSSCGEQAVLFIAL